MDRFHKNLKLLFKKRKDYHRKDASQYPTFNAKNGNKLFITSSTNTLPIKNFPYLNIETTSLQHNLSTPQENKHGRLI